MPERTPDSTTQALAKRPAGGLARTAIEVIAAIPEEEIWLAGLKSEQTRRAYRKDVVHFVETFGIQSFEELRQVTHKRECESTTNPLERWDGTCIRFNSGPCQPPNRNYYSRCRPIHYQQ
ncbi:MAG: hypothetical protein O7D91_04565 [Planctomycetota bacterium]|nr:hypothetical protein [Planctomycetota bacterium]